MKKLLSSYILCFAFCFMLFIYEPILMYATNMNDFWFDLGIMIVPVIKIFLIFLIFTILMVSILYFFNKLLSKTKFKIFKDYKIFNIIILIGFILFFVTYIQGNYLIGNLPPLDGSEINWGIYTTDNLITAGILLIFIALSIFLCYKIKINNTIKYASYLSIAVVFMLSISLISTLISNNAFATKNKGVIFSERNINNVSENQNFYIFLLDAVDSESFYNTLKESSKYKDLFEDFTYYSDALSLYAYTRDTIPFLLSGKVNRNENEFSKYSSDALNTSSLFEKLKESNYDINLYDIDLIWNGNKSYKIDNVINITDSKIDLFSFFKQEIKYIIFKYAPYSLKKYSKIIRMDFNLCTEKFRWGLDTQTKIIKENPILNKLKNNQFQLIHTEGAHMPFNIDENLKRLEDNGTYEQKIKANFVYIKEFLDRLKENDSYDNSIIIILADHGFQTNENIEYPDYIFYRYNPILFIKGINEKHEMINSTLPVSYLDLPNAYNELLDGKKSTELFKNVKENRTRKMIFYEYMKENHMEEYETNGKAWEVDKFKKTENVYDR